MNVHHLRHGVNSCDRLKGVADTYACEYAKYRFYGASMPPHLSVTAFQGPVSFRFGKESPGRHLLDSRILIDTVQLTQRLKPCTVETGSQRPT